MKRKGEGRSFGEEESESTVLRKFQQGQWGVPELKLPITGLLNPLGISL